MLTQKIVKLLICIKAVMWVHVVKQLLQMKAEEWKRKVKKRASMNESVPLFVSHLLFAFWAYHEQTFHRMGKYCKGNIWEKSYPIIFIILIA